MPITIYPTTLKYKDSTGTFQSATALKGDSGEAIVEQVNGTTPTITCEANHRYICNEVSALNITPSANGVCEIIFTSGDNATALTAPNTIKWPEWFSPDALEPNATYSFKISNNLANVAIWPEEGLTGNTRVRIQKMLGIYQAPWELIREDTFTSDTNGDIEITVDNNGQPFELTDVNCVIRIPMQDTTVTITDYALAYFYYGTEDRMVISLIGSNPYTVAPNTSNRIGMVDIRQSGGLAELKCIQYQGETGRTNLQMPAYYATSTYYNPFVYGNVSFNRVKLRNVTGTVNVRLYGKRKWN